MLGKVFKTGNSVVISLPKDALELLGYLRDRMSLSTWILAAEFQTPDLAMLENIHVHKTGALIRAGVRMATLAKPDLDPQVAERLDRYAKCLGLAFQIRDDILDVEGDSAVIGKTSGKDQAQEKATYPALMGLAHAREAAEGLIAEAQASLDGFGNAAEPLRWVADYMVKRDR